MSQKVLEMDTLLVVLTSSGRALCDVMLGAVQGNAQLVPHLDEACLHVDSLISKGVCRGAHAALTSVGSYYGDNDFDAVSQGCVSGRSKSDILAIGSFTARGAEVLASKMSTASIHHSTSLLVYESF